jgi:hypothetical protein
MLLAGPRRFALQIVPALARFRYVTVQEIVEERPDHGNRGQPPDIIASRGARRLDDVGRELESQAGDQPAGLT